MNKAAATKEGLLQIAREIAYREGLSKLSIRRLASESGIATGTMYNYFPSKADLVAQILEEFWREVFHGSHFDADSQDFISSVEEIYVRFHTSLAVFRKEFLEDLEGMEKVEKEKCHQTELFYVNHVKAGMLQILCRDSRILPEVWSRDFTREQLVEFTFSNMVMMLKEGREDCGYFTQVLERLLYRAADRHDG